MLYVAYKKLWVKWAATSDIHYFMHGIVSALYLWDWSELKYEAELYFLRDVDKRKVDFLITIGGKPWLVALMVAGRD